MKNSLQFHGNHYTMIINGIVAKLDLSLNLLNPEDFTDIEILLIKWSVI